MKIKTLTSIIFSSMICLFIALNITSGKEEEGNEKIPIISGTLYSQAGCGNEPVEGADYYMFNRTTNSMICSGQKTDSNGRFICAASYSGPDIVYIQFTKKGKVGCYLLERTNSNQAAINVCMTNSGSCPNEW